jgi:cbb3-type cytochrome c oxidase subunit III
MSFRHRPILLVVFVLSVSCFFLAQIALTQTVTNRRQYTRIEAAKGKAAKKLFKQHCVRCHGEDGVGETPRGQIVGATDLTDQDWQKRVDDQRLVNSITHGRGEMPAFTNKLSKDQIKSLLAYVRAFKK